MNAAKFFIEFSNGGFESGFVTSFHAKQFLSENGFEFVSIGVFYNKEMQLQANIKEKL